jgi:hypothetical protein
LTGVDALAAALLREAREEVTRADEKIAALLAAFGIGASVVAGAILAGDWSPRDLDRPWELCWWLGAAAAGAATGSLGWAILPRITHRLGGPTVGYFNDVALLDGTEILHRALEKVDPSERVVSQLYSVSVIARRKYLWLRRGMTLMALSLALAVVAAVGPLIHA